MKKRTKLLSGLTAGVLTLGAMCFGYASWSSEITVNGNVSANGKWDVAVTDASMQVSSAGAAVNAASSYNSFDKGELLATRAAVKNAMNAKIAELEANGCTVISSDDSLTKRYAYISYYPDAASKTDFRNKEFIGFYDTADEAKAAAAARAEEIKAAGGSVNSYGQSGAYGYEIACTDPSGDTVTFDSDSVTYAPVEFTLPEAWASYTVTVTNNGTVNANLKDYDFSLSELDSAIYTIEQPTNFDDEVLSPGASCTFTFVVKVNDSEDDITSEAAPFKITLNYEQDAVEAAPEAGHAHSDAQN